MPGLLQQAQKEQPAVSRAEAEQQQEPRHRLVPQSEEELQRSPGGSLRQAPEPGSQELQEDCRALALHTKPPLQEAEPGEQELPGAVDTGARAARLMQELMLVPPVVRVEVPEGQGLGVKEPAGQNALGGHWH